MDSSRSIYWRGGFISVNPSVMNILDIFLGVTPCCSLEMCKNKQFCKFGHASALRGMGDMSSLPKPFSVVSFRDSSPFPNLMG